MSDHLPFHIQEEIMKRLPVKSLVQFRSVSKAWKSLIDSSEFITTHSLRRHTQPHYLLVSHKIPDFEGDYVLFSRCYIDDDPFPHQQSSPTRPQSIQQLDNPIVVGSSQGLLCLYAYPDSHPNFTPPPTEIAVIWNPSIRKSIVVDVPAKPHFGVCPVTSDPKIVAFTHFSKANVYSLNSGTWRSVSTNLPSKPTQTLHCSIVTDRFIYWDVQLQNLNMIMSFDLSNESFEMIEFPDGLVRHDTRFLRISKLRDSLALIEYEYGDDYSFSAVWMLEDGARRSFTKLFTITTPNEEIVGFMKNGMPIMKVTDENYTCYRLVVHEPNSEHNNVLEVCPLYCVFHVDSFMETLLLLGRSDCSSY